MNAGGHGQAVESPMAALLRVLGEDRPERIDAELVALARAQSYPLMKGYPSLLADMAHALHEAQTTAPEERAVRTAAIFSQLEHVVSGLGIGLRPDRPAWDGAPPFLGQLWKASRQWHDGAFFAAANDIAADRQVAALRKLESICANWRHLHDAYVGAMASMLELAREHSTATMLGVLHRTAQASRTTYDNWSNASHADLLAILRKLLHAHGSIFVERTVGRTSSIELTYCASGGMLLATGALAMAPDFSYVASATEGAIANRLNHSSYCAHCAMWNEQLPLTWHGRPIFTVRPHHSDPARCSLSINMEAAQEKDGRQYLLHPGRDF